MKADAYVRRLLDAAVARVQDVRYTFSERLVLEEIWKAGYDVTLQNEPRFVMAREADGKYPRQWRLPTQTLANNRLLDALKTGQWDGKDLETELVRLEALDGVRYIFCPLDERFKHSPDGTWQPAEAEDEIELPQVMREQLDALLPSLLARWRDQDNNPWTTRHITDVLGELGWSDASKPEMWVLVRAWLRREPALTRVGQDYWIPSERLPQPPHSRVIRVGPVVSKAREHGSESIFVRAEARRREDVRGFGVSPDVSDARGIAAPANWTIALRTIHLIEGFVPIRASARGVYPPRAAGSGAWQVVRGKWFDTGDDLWIWIDREHDRLCGPDLADKLAWCEAGLRLRVTWTSDGVVFRPNGVDEQVREEETRLVDAEALKELRGELGESYLQSLIAILDDRPEGATFANLVEAMRERQHHAVHCGTIRALLSAGGFLQKDGQWFVTPEAKVGSRRRLKRAVAASSVTHAEERVDVEDAGEIVRRVHRSLSEIVALLRAQSGRT